MIATKRGLAVLGGLAAVLVVLLVVCTGNKADDAPKDRSLVPGFDEQQISKLEFESGDTKWTIERAGSEWRFANASAVVDRSALDAIFTALRGAKWHRRVAAKQPTQPRRSIRFNDTTLVLGDVLAETDQRWIIHGKHAYLVDGWVATALVPEPITLRGRHPLAGCTTAAALDATLGEAKLRLVGSHLVEPRNAWIDDKWVRAIAAACDAVEIAELGGGQPTKPGLTIVLEGRGTFAEVGTCANDRVFVTAASGEGCVDRAHITALHDALRALIDKAHDTIDLRPLPIAPVKLTLPDGAVLDLTGKPRFDDAEADADAVRALVGALTAPGKRIVEFPRTRPRGTYFAVAKDTHQISVTLFDKVVARSGELGAIEVDDATWEILTRPSAALRDPTRWREDAANITELKLDNVKYKRGAVLGEWTRDRAGAVDNALVGALAETLGTVRAPAAATRPARVAHRLRVTITPPTGSEIRHEIEIGEPTQLGCPGRIDREPVTLPLAMCTAAIALAATK